jgi:hypothetical protein
MAKNIILPAYGDGESVIVDLSGSGKPYYFGKVVDSKPIKHGCNDTFEYAIEGLEYPVNEYCVRSAKTEDIQLKELYDNLKIQDFEIDDDRIKRVFWAEQKPILKKATNFINYFLYPYLKTKGHIVSVEDMTDWDASYKKGMHTKNEYVFIIPHDIFNIVVQKNSTYVSLFITLPTAYRGSYSDGDNKPILNVICMATEYSDEEYTEIFIKVTKEIISQLEKGKEKGYYNLYIKSELRDSLSLYKEVLNPLDTYVRSKDLPGYEYTRFLMDLSVMKHYFFNSNFTLEDAE